MANDLKDTWNDIATLWSRWKAPLRPCPEDISIMRDAIETWRFDGYASSVDGYAKVVLLGVTPEIANMDFPLPVDLLAIDRSDNMIKQVWPGDTDQRHAVQGDWITYHVPADTQDIVMADGSLVFFSPDRMDHLVSTISRMLKTDGIFVARCFVLPDPKETITPVFQAVRAKMLPNFHQFKFRLAMALQKNFEEGVSQDEVWKSMQSILTAVPGNGYSSDDLSTGDVYRGKTARHYFPTIDELTAILKKYFISVKVVTPTSYEFGPCCPTVIAQSRR